MLSTGVATQTDPGYHRSVHPAGVARVARNAVPTLHPTQFTASSLGSTIELSSVQRETSDMVSVVWSFPHG